MRPLRVPRRCHQAAQALQQALEPHIVDMPPQAVPDMLPDCMNSPSPVPGEAGACMASYTGFQCGCGVEVGCLVLCCSGEGALLDMAEELMTPSEAQVREPVAHSIPSLSPS